MITAFLDETFALGRTLLDQALKDDVGFMSRIAFFSFSALAFGSHSLVGFVDG